MKLRFKRPLWLERARGSAGRRYPQLRRRLTVDVAVVGGGVTGAAVAWRFAAAGIRVAVLEAARVAGGSTAASTALLMQEPDKDLAELQRKYGNRAARRSWQLSRLATRELVQALTRLGIRCELDRCRSVYYALTSRDAVRLRDEFQRRRAAGFPGRWLDDSAVARRVGFDACGAIETPGNAQVDPVKACRGLMAAAKRLGAQIFENSHVMRIDHDDEGVTVKTRRGKVRARCVVIATGYATAEFRPLAGRFRMMHTYVIATERLRAAAPREIRPRSLMLWDTDRPYHYARWTRDGRLLLGGADRPRMRGGRRREAINTGAQSLRAHFIDVFPALESVDIEYAWEGLFAMTADGLPYIGPHRRYPKHLFALGYGGNGMTFGFLASRLLLEQYQGVRSRDHDLFAFGRTRR